jgi:hypothetical protein
MSRTAELERRMQEVIDTAGDVEADHAKADAILIEAARFAGFDTLCDLYERVEKWYA